MIQTQNQKLFLVTAPAAIVDNASLTTNVIDTKGWDYVDIYVIYGAMDIATTVLKVQEADAASDATTLTSGADVTGLVYGTSTNSAGSTSSLPTATSDNTIFAFRVDCRARKRYLKPIVTLGDGTSGTFAIVVAVLSRGNAVPNSASTRGVAQELVR